MRVSAGVAIFVGVLLSTGVARAADTRDPVAAEALFAAGKALMDRGDFRQACPKLEESYRLDPATGALYALALCHERQGKLATAWAQFLDAAARSNAEKNTARENAARQHAEALEPRLSFLIVRVDTAAAGVPGLTITLNGVALRPAAWGTPVPIDPGSHQLKAVAPGREQWQSTVTIAKDRQREVVEVPELRASDPSVAGPGAKPEDEPRAWTDLTPVQFAGVAVGGAGIGCLGIAAYASIRALDKNADSNEGGKCDENDECNAEGERDRNAAVEAANFATLGAIAGSALLGAGLVMFFVGGDDDKKTKQSVSATLTPRGVSIQGSF
jgi:tetratricopeptide (TPR) repeat protein